jgi:hypothetical protein
MAINCKSPILKPSAHGSRLRQRYRDLRRFGSVPHSGFGLGFERLIMLSAAQIRGVCRNVGFSSPKNTRNGKKQSRSILVYYRELMKQWLHSVLVARHRNSWPCGWSELSDLSSGPLVSRTSGMLSHTPGAAWEVAPNGVVHGFPQLWTPENSGLIL